MSDVIYRLNTLLSSVNSTVGTSPIQISGGPAANWPLSGVAAGYFPNYRRMYFRVINTESATIYMGSTGSIASTGGAGCIPILPGNWVDDHINGSVVRYLVGSQSGCGFTVEEYD